MVMCLMAWMVVVTGCDQKKTAQSPKGGAVKAVVKGDEVRIPAEDSADFVAVLNTYLEYSREFADSAAKTAGRMPLGPHPGDPRAEAAYQRNIGHVDSVMRQCIALVKDREYRRVLDVLNEERMNIYSHPGNMIDNELDLRWVVERISAEVYHQRDTLAVRMLPWYEFNALHMELLQAMGKGEHPEYLSTLKVLSFIYERTGDKERLQETLEKIGPREVE